MKTRIRIGVEEERGGCGMEKTQQDDKKMGYRRRRMRRRLRQDLLIIKQSKDNKVLG